VVEILLVLHLVVLLALYRLLERQVGRIIAIVFLVYMAAFTVLKPALLYYFDVHYDYSPNDYASVVAMLAGSLLFLCIEYVTIRILANYKPGRVLLQWLDFSHIKPYAIWLTFVIFMVISFVGSAIRFADLGYLWSSMSTFDAATNQANGSYYINFVAEATFYAAIMVVGFYCARLAPAKLFVLLIFTLTITYLWSRLAARTGVLVMLITWLPCTMSAARQRSLSIAYIAFFGYVILVLLYVGNLARLGSLDSMDVSKAAFGAALAAASDMGPDDNAVLLYSEMRNHENTNFLQLAGALTPLVLIPSSIFPIKIPADKDAELTRIFFPEGADTSIFHEGSILTFTVPASGYADAGYLGVFVSSLVYALLFCVYIWIYRRGSASARYVVSVFMIIHIVGYRLSVEALLMSFYTSFLIMAIARWLAIFISELASFQRTPVLAPRT
jgi:hypothetical protein